MMIIAPSVLSMDFSKSNQQLQEIEQAGAKWIHFDVMDGHFVKNITFGPDVLKGIHKMSSLFLDVHLMIDKPWLYAPKFIEAHADQITVHYESFSCDDQLHEFIDQMHQHHVKVGITCKPKTDYKQLVPFLSKVDLVLVMSVEPGFGGQSFMVEALDKITYFDQLRKEHHYTYLIEVDGGINDDTAKQCLEVGCDVLVAGSYIFNHDIYKRIESLCQ